MKISKCRIGMRVAVTVRATTVTTVRDALSGMERGPARACGTIIAIDMAKGVLLKDDHHVICSTTWYPSSSLTRLVKKKKFMMPEPMSPEDALAAIHDKYFHASALSVSFKRQWEKALLLVEQLRREKKLLLEAKEDQARRDRAEIDRLRRYREEQIDVCSKCHADHMTILERMKTAESLVSKWAMFRESPLEKKLELAIKCIENSECDRNKSYVNGRLLESEHSNLCRRCAALQKLKESDK